MRRLIASVGLGLLAASAGAVDSGYDLDLRLRASGGHRRSLERGERVEIEVAIRPATTSGGQCFGIEIVPSACWAFSFTLVWPSSDLEMVSFEPGPGIPAGWPTPSLASSPGRLQMGAFSTGPELAAEAVVLRLVLEARSSSGTVTIEATEIDFGDSGGNSICGAFDTPGDAGVPGDYWDELFVTILDLEPAAALHGVVEPLPDLREPRGGE